MNGLSRLVSGMVLLCGILGARQGLAQGSLTPPGAPAATMRTLVQVEPRLPISGPTDISESGAYYLTTNIHGTITITTNQVTLDLMGYALVGSNAPSSFGIVLGQYGYISIQNGFIRNFDSGISINGGQSITLRDLTITGNRTVGIKILSANRLAEGIIVEHCLINANTNGLILSSYASPCRGIVIRNNTFCGNGAYGIKFDGSASAGGCVGNVIEHCIVTGNGQHGIYFDGIGGHCDRNRIAHCTIADNATGGIRTTGVIAENRIEHNHLANNFNGLYLDNVDNHGNYVADNTIIGNINIGICVQGPENLIVRNSIKDGGPAYSFGPSNSMGGVATVTGMGFTNSNPWINFLY